MAGACTERGQQLVFVCSELMLRGELILADLDTLAPVLQSEELAAAAGQRCCVNNYNAGQLGSALSPL